MNTRSYVSMIIAATILGIAMLAMLSCGSSPWSRAKRKDTIVAYQEFVAAHPKSEHVEEAKTRIAKIKEEEAERKRRKAEIDEKAWKKASRAATVEAFAWYLQEHEDGAHAADAKQQIDALILAEIRAAAGPEFEEKPGAEFPLRYFAIRDVIPAFDSRNMRTVKEVMSKGRFTRQRTDSGYVTTFSTPIKDPKRKNEEWARVHTGRDLVAWHRRVESTVRPETAVTFYRVASADKSLMLYAVKKFQDGKLVKAGSNILGTGYAVLEHGGVVEVYRFRDEDKKESSSEKK